jgi:diacylglycerol kinase
MAQGAWGGAGVAARSGSVRSFLLGVACAARGVGLTTRTQRHFRAHLLIGAAASVAAIGLGFTPVESGVLGVAIGLVLAVELVNTAIERLTDMVMPGEDARAAAVKDVAAGAVLMTSIVAVAVGVVLFLPRLVPASAPAVARGLPAALAAVLLGVLLAGLRRPAR